MTTLNPQLIARVIRKTLMPGEDYRGEIINFINTQFLDFAMNFFQDIVKAKMQNLPIGVDWYKKAMMNENLPPADIAINAGINKKTISNVRGSATRKIVIEAAHQNYEHVKEIIENLVKDSEGINLTLTIKFNKASVELDISESLIVINALAVKRAAMRGGAWSSVGKQVEKPLMLTLCRLYSVDSKNYDIKQKSSDGQGDFEREIDFFFISQGTRHKCEVKLMGKGNPESADVVIARGSRVFIADTLSEMNITQLDSLGVEWVHLKVDNGYRRFATVLKKLKIPYKEYKGNLEKDIDKIIEEAMA